MIRLICITAALCLVACSKDSAVPSQDIVHKWAKTTTTRISKAAPSAFKMRLEHIQLPHNLDYSGYNLTYARGSNMHATLKENDREFLKNMGIISVLSEQCQLDWQQENFLPMMRWRRERLPEAERQGYYIAIFGFNHGVVMGMADQHIKNIDIQCEKITPILKGNLFSHRFSLP